MNRIVVLRNFCTAAIIALAFAACASHPPQAKPVASARPLLIESRGVVMPLQNSIREISFRPFIPRGTVLEVAVIPPLGGKDARESRGLAIEYAGASANDAMLLSQWPRRGFDIAVGGIQLTGRPCAPVAYKNDALLWTTRHGRVVTLQPDGIVPRAEMEREVRRLIASGAC